MKDSSGTKCLLIAAAAALLFSVTLTSVDCADASTAYKVKKGDNIHKIAKKFKTTPSAIKDANDLDSDKLKVGRKLVIPSEKKVRTAKVKDNTLANKSHEQEISDHNSPDKQIYRVKKRDTLSKIAKKFNTTPDRIKDANDLDSNRLKVGSRIVIPSARTVKNVKPEAAEKKHVAGATKQETTGHVDSDKEKPEPVYRHHRVKRGETLASIARDHGLSVRELRSINDIKKRKKVSVGQNLIVGNVPGGKSAAGSGRIKRVNVSAKIEQVKVLSESPELENMPATDRLLLFAKKMLDLPYKFGANGMFGLDCSSFVQRVYSFIDMKLPRSAREQFEVGQEIPKKDLKSGDLLFFRTYARFPSHVGIYIGDNMFIHASSVSKKVTIDSIDKPYYVQRFIGAKRLLTDTADKVEDAAAAIVSESMKRH
jgi:peptidoglycan DL-endopeptidase LytE